MDPSFLHFTPAPVRARRDGWDSERQRRFVLNLARGMSVGEAAARVGRSRQTAYALRERPGAEGFAAAWDEAVLFAARVRAAPGSCVPGAGAIENLLVPRFYRGRLIGFVQREDVHGAMRALAQLDRLAERIDPPLADSEALEDCLDWLASRSKADKADKIGLANASTSSASVSRAPSRRECAGSKSGFSRAASFREARRSG